jgi:hypothetical protein
MMKNKFLFGVLLTFFLSCFIQQSFGQSDYEIVQNFKQKYQDIEQAIKDADSLSDINTVPDRIDQLRSQYLPNKQLLDKSLYPDDFEGLFTKLRNAYALRSDDFVQIDVLHTEVTGLQEQVDTLSKHNTDLMNAVQMLEEQSKTDRTQIAQLEKAVAELKASLLKRDEVVMSMIDSLLPPSYRGKDQLSAQEQQEVFSEAEKNNVLFHIKSSVKDNTRFLKVTTLYSQDISEVMDEHEEFSKIWRSVGPKLVDIYAAKGKNTDELKEIDAAFAEWSNAINREVWESITEEFSEHDVVLPRFANGNEFTETITSYINDEIDNVDTKGEEAETAYKNFDSTWSNSVEPEWIPFLVDNKMITAAQQDTIETKMSEWKEKVYPASFNWLYVIIAVLIIAVIVLFFVRKSPKGVREPGM